VDESMLFQFGIEFLLKMFGLIEFRSALNYMDYHFTLTEHLSINIGCIENV